jgi:hypothetical protein
LRYPRHAPIAAAGAAAACILMLAVPVTWWRLTEPFTGVSFMVEEEGEHALVRGVLAGSTAEAIGVEVGDRLIAIGSVEIFTRPDHVRLWGNYFDVLNRYRAGDTVAWRIERDGEPQTLMGELLPVPRGLLISQGIVFGSFWLLAFFLLWARQETKAVRYLAWAVLAVTTGQYFRFAGGMALTDAVAVAVIQVSILARFLGPALVIHFGLVFPTDWRRPRAKRTVLALAYGIPFLLLLVETALMLRGLRDQAVPYLVPVDITERLRYYDVRFWVFVGSFGVCGLLLLQTYRRLHDSVDRRRIKWVVWGVLLAAGIDVLVMAGIYYRLGYYPVQRLESYRNLLYLVPAAGLGISVFRHDLFDVDRILRHTAVYLATVASLFLMFAGIESVVSHVLQEVVPAAGLIGSIAGGILTATAFWPLRRWLDRRVKGMSRPPAAAG